MTAGSSFKSPTFIRPRAIELLRHAFKDISPYFRMILFGRFGFRLDKRQAHFGLLRSERTPGADISAAIQQRGVRKVPEAKGED